MMRRAIRRILEWALALTEAEQARAVAEHTRDAAWLAGRRKAAATHLPVLLQRPAIQERAQDGC